jgi:hypothetical protein
LTITTDIADSFAGWIPRDIRILQETADSFAGPDISFQLVALLCFQLDTYGVRCASPLNWDAEL